MAEDLHIPLAPGAWPVLGHLVPVLRDPLAFLTHLPEAGSLVRIRVGPVNAIEVCDPELTRQVLVGDRAFDKGGPLWDRARESMGNGLPTCLHDEHRSQRRLIQPVLASARLPGYACIMTGPITEMTESWTESWHDGQVIDARTEMLTLTSKVLVAAMFSDVLSPAGVRQAVNDLNAIVYCVHRRMLMPDSLARLPILGNRRYQRALARFRSRCDAIIADRRTNNTGNSGDLLSQPLAVRDDGTRGHGAGGDSLTDSEITDQITTFFAAGTETVATTLAWALHLLIQHPDIADRPRTEADAVLGGRPAAYADLPYLKLTGRIVTETLRLRPPIWFFTQVVTADTRIGGHRLPAGATVILSPYLIHRRSDVYPDPGQNARPAPAGTLNPRGLTLRAVKRTPSGQAVQPGWEQRTRAPRYLEGPHRPRRPVKAAGLSWTRVLARMSAQVRHTVPSSSHRRGPGRRSLVSCRRARGTARAPAPAPSARATPGTDPAPDTIDRMLHTLDDSHRE
ncbi:cytochrome P450 [Streptomyces sp. SB3404]|uniref:Cytochrome P450 n=2 Tax=Streptomyces boncukensis TaxID=2711219 RepID=A0A6G4WZ29_9ACTN|nr:cytochrome P450 [Streptomyces boncukensis]